MKSCKECSVSTQNDYCDLCSKNVVASKSIKGVLMKNTSFKEQRILDLAKKAEISAWYAQNGHLVDAVVENEVIPFETAEELRLLTYFTDSLKKTRKSSSSVALSDEVVNYSETAYIEDVQEENDMDEDFIWDMGGNESKVERQYKAAILTGDYSQITKRSSVYEDGGGIGLVRSSVALHGNDNVFVAAGSEMDLQYKEDRMTEGYANQLAERYTARRAVELEMRDYAIERYKYYASLVVDQDSIVAYAEDADCTTKLVRADLKAKFGKEYIYQACKYTHKGKRYGSFDQCFHDHMFRDIILPVKNQLKVDARRAMYLDILEAVDRIPCSSPRHLAWLILNKHQEFGIDVSKISDALGYAWENNRFPPAIYYALKDLKDKVA